MIPASTQSSIDNYSQFGIVPGSFLQAVLNNDLKGAFAYADADNATALGEIVRYLYAKAPCACWGHDKAWQNWVKLKQDEYAKQ